MPTKEQRAKILQAAETYGGSHIPFNQSYQDIKTQRMLAGFYNDKTLSFHDKVYIGGMCHSMSLYWLALRAAGKKSFFEWLKPGGTWNKGSINVLVIKTGMYKNGKNQFVPDEVHGDFDDRFFAHYNLRRTGTGANGMPEILAYIDRQTPGYHMIGLGGEVSGHAVAAHVTSSGPSAFFDPNYGEYSFETALWLGTFMRVFMDVSGYAKKYTKSVTIETFA